MESWLKRSCYLAWLIRRMQRVIQGEETGLSETEVNLQAEKQRPARYVPV